jgi:S1-C subfamily serine protease
MAYNLERNLRPYRVELVFIKISIPLITALQVVYLTVYNLQNSKVNVTKSEIDRGEKKMLIVRQSPQSFEEIVTYVLPSVIPIAIGSDADGRPIIEGTGFAIEHSGIFATCWHIGVKYRELSLLNDEEVRARGMRDNFLRIAARNREGLYIWHKVEKGTLMHVMEENHDLFVFRLVDVSIPPLALHREDAWDMGAEVGVIGFPMGNTLQAEGNMLQPYILKTIVSGAVRYTTGEGTRTPQLALNTLIASGYSGGPVFSAKDGSVVGMVRSQLTEGEGIRMPNGITFAVVPSTIRQGMNFLLDTTIKIIQRALWPDIYPEQTE